MVHQISWHFYLFLKVLYYRKIYIGLIKCKRITVHQTTQNISQCTKAIIGRIGHYLTLNIYYHSFHSPLQPDAWVTVTPISSGYWYYNDIRISRSILPYVTLRS